MLVVDDAPDSLSFLTDVLENVGMTALVAHNGKSALSLLNHVTPDLILMDAVMPGMDGFETCAAIKRDEDRAHIPLIFMTGLSDTESIVKGFSAGGVDYITKPVNAEELTARILVHLTNSRMTQSARMALDASGTPLVAVDGDGAILWITPEASRILRKALPENASGSFQTLLAPSFAGVITAKAGRAAMDGPFTKPVNASYLGEADPGEHLIRLNDSNSPHDVEALSGTLGLTKREAEVLYWITQGKSNRDVAEILSCSPRTVNKHLEQIYSKLNVENRTAAAMLAVRTLMEG